MIIRHLLPERILPLVILLLFFFVAGPSKAAPKKTYFPEFDSIRDNIVFWERIYAEFSVNTAVVHDKEDLSIIYETVPLLDKSLPGASRLNETYLKAIRKKYTSALTDLGRGKPAETALERRLMQMFPGPDIRSQLQRASRNIRIQSGLKERFLEGVIRSGKYMDEMKSIFRSYGLPEDLAYLPHVESSFNVKAYSKFGAAGVWQFTHSTGKDFMTIDYILDERRDPLTATHAAAKYLKKNFENLGTWPLAITAYNYGHAGMLRALKQEGNYESIFSNYRKGHFKFASRNFYSEFLAARNVAKSLERVPKIQKERPLKNLTYTMPAYAPAAEVASHLGINLSDLEELNPALRPPVWKGEKYIPKGYQIRVPHNQNTLQRLHAMPSTLFRNQQKRSKFYTVRRGDTAGQIARRFGVSLTSLSRANNLDSNGLVYIGQTLRIPGNSNRRSSAPLPATVVMASASVAILEDGKKSLPGLTVSQSPSLPGNGDLHVARMASGSDGRLYGEIIVQPEESMGLYAEWLKIDKTTLHSLNGFLPGTALHPGQRIKVPLHVVSKGRFEEKRIEFHQENEEDFFSAYRVTGFKNYKVSMGDTLWDICQNKFDLPLWLLKKYNNDLQYNNLASNQHLQIPIIEAL